MTDALPPNRPVQPQLAAEEWLTLLRPLRPHLSIAHQVPGRVRLRLSAAGIASISPGLIGKLQSGIAAAPAIHAVRVNLPALSVVIEYDPRRIPADWWPALLRADPEEAVRLVAEIGSS